MEKIKNKTKIIIFVLLISLFGAIFLWNFWQSSVNVVGVNGMLYSFLFVGFFIYLKKDVLTKESLLWLIPVSLICLSLGIYTNSFTKSISLFLLPLIFFVFTTQEVHKMIRPGLWSRFMPIELISAGFIYVSNVFDAFKLFSFKKSNISLPRLSKEKRDLTVQISLGIVILIILSAIIVIPLLSSADREFEGLFSGIMQFFSNTIGEFFRVLGKFLGTDLFARLLLTGIGMMLLLGYAIYWLSEWKKSPVLEQKDHFGEKYSITISIILTGVLVLYLIFIGLQIKTLFVGSLPINFEQAENLVKTGFWQLFMLTLINILFYIGLYQKSTKTTQRILSLFTFASLLLIISAAYRIYLYVANYGFSYEKFYAFYTVIFCIGVFIWFLYLDITKKSKPEIVRNLAFSSLWMYALTTVMPLEKMIFSANLALTQQSDSRVNINELHMLGFDALPLIEKHFDQLIIESEKDKLQNIEQFTVYLSLMGNGDVRTDWLLWMDQSKEQSQYRNWSQMTWEKGIEKRWYEKTISELIY